MENIQQEGKKTLPPQLRERGFYFTSNGDKAGYLELKGYERVDLFPEPKTGMPVYKFKASPELKAAVNEYHALGRRRYGQKQ